VFLRHRPVKTANLLVSKSEYAEGNNKSLDCRAKCTARNYREAVSGSIGRNDNAVLSKETVARKNRSDFRTKLGQQAVSAPRKLNLWATVIDPFLYPCPLLTTARGR
jgi:hypothetical protein